MAEFDEAIQLAHRVLDRPWSDPDDDLAILSRQLLRLKEKVDLHQESHAEERVRYYRNEWESACERAESAEALRKKTAKDLAQAKKELEAYGDAMEDACDDVNKNADIGIAWQKRAEAAEAQLANPRFLYDGRKIDLERAEAKAAKYREALERLLPFIPEMSYGVAACYSEHAQAANQARVALAGEKGEGNGD